MKSIEDAELAGSPLTIAMHLVGVQSAAFLSLAFQNSHDCNYCVPISCCRGRTEQFIDLAKIADRFHVTTVHSEDKSALVCDNSQEPLPFRWNCDWNGSPNAAGFRQDAHESNDIRT